MFRLRAVLAAGLLLAAVPAIPAHAAGFSNPTAPIITAVTARDGGADVSVIASNLIKYFPVTVTAHPGEQQVKITDPTHPTARFSGLANGTDYTFTAGQYETAQSEASPSVRPGPGTVPGEPAIRFAYGRDHGALLSWDEPSDGGSDLTGYQITSDRSDQTWRPAADQHQLLLNLPDGAQTLRVSAVNKVGAGQASTVEVTPRAAYPPGPATDVTALPDTTANSATLDVSWQPPADDGGSDVTGYTVYGAGDPVQVDGTRTRLTDLEAGKQYSLTVVARNQAGDGERSKPTASVSPTAEAGKDTTVLSHDSLDTLAELAPTSLTFDNPTDQVKEITVGRILVAGTHPNAPAGLLRKVTSIKKTGELGKRLVLRTEDATLQDAVPQGEAEISEQLKASDVRSFRALRPGVRMGATGGPLSFDLFTNPNEDDATTTAGVRGELSGDITVQPDVDFYFSLGFFNPTFKFTGTAKINAAIDGKLAAYVRSELANTDLADVDFACQTFFVGPVPIVLCPSFTLSASLTAEGSLELSFHGSYSQTIGGRVGWENHGWHTENLTTEPVKEFSARLDPQVQMALEFPANLTVYLYGLAGPGLQAVPYVTFTARPTDVPWAAVDVGSRFDITFKVKSLDLDYAYTVGDLSYRVWDSGPKRYDGLKVEPAMTSVPAGEHQKFTATRLGCDGATAPVVFSLAPGATGSITPDGDYTAGSATGGHGHQDDVIVSQAEGGGCEAQTGDAAVHTGFTRPQAPAGLTVAPEGQGIRVSWQKPADDGGEAPTEYAVVVRERLFFTEPLVNVRTADMSWTPNEIRGRHLREAGATVQVLARNSAGWSPVSEAVEAPQ
jgi:hypothetical protein